MRRGDTLSAGFVEWDVDGRPLCMGRSESLDLDSRADDTEALRAEWGMAVPTTELVARVVSSGPAANLPCLQWLSADHSLRTSIGALLFANAADVAPAAPLPPSLQADTSIQTTEPV